MFDFMYCDSNGNVLDTQIGANTNLVIDADMNQHTQVDEDDGSSEEAYQSMILVQSNSGTNTEEDNVVEL